MFCWGGSLGAAGAVLWRSGSFTSTATDPEMRFFPPTITDLTTTAIIIIFVYSHFTALAHATAESTKSAPHAFAHARNYDLCERTAPGWIADITTMTRRIGRASTSSSKKWKRTT